MLTDEMKQSLKAELINDPTGRGYAGAADATAKAALFNNPYTIQVPQDMPARVTQVLTQAAAPNAVTADDVTAALA